MKEINILWFKKDLRIFDNEALCEAIKDNDILPIYIIELDIWSQNTHSDRQWQFCKESLIDLRNALTEIGQPLIIRTGNVINIFDEISSKFKIKGIYSHQETGDWLTYKRDQKVREWALSKNIIWKEFLQFSVFRGVNLLFNILELLFFDIFALLNISFNEMHPQQIYEKTIILGF